MTNLTVSFNSPNGITVGNTTIDTLGNITVGGTVINGITGAITSTANLTIGTTVIGSSNEHTLSNIAYTGSYNDLSNVPVAQTTLPNPYALTFNTTSGVTAGSTYTGNAAVTVDYTSVGAAPASHTHSYQAADADLLAIAGLAGSTGFLKKTAADTWTLDTSTFATGSGTASGTNTGDQTLPTLISLGAQAALGNASASVSGVLTSTDWATFNGKGYLNVPQNSQSAAYTLVLDDAGKHILHPSADTAAKTFTIPANASVAYPIGTTVTFVNQHGAGIVTIAITSDAMYLAGAGTTGSRSLAANGIATAIKVATTEWMISGSGVT